MVADVNVTTAQAGRRIAGKQPGHVGASQAGLQGGLQPAHTDGQSSQVTLQPAHIPDGSEGMTPQEFLTRYSSHKREIPLSQLGVHPTNRKGKYLNGAHVEKLMMRIRKGSKGGGEDFQTYRYSPARVVEPDPQDPSLRLAASGLELEADPTRDAVTQSG